MPKAEAKQILTAEVEALRAKSYAELVVLIDADQNYERKGSSGKDYQVEVLVLWDDPRKPNENLRVMVFIDDGGFFSAIKPLSSDFIKSPDNNFVGE